MKVCLARVDAKCHYTSYDDYDQILRLIPETDFEEISQDDYLKLKSYIEGFESGDKDYYKYILLSLPEKPVFKETLQNALIKFAETVKLREERKAKAKAKQEKAAANSRERKLRQLAKLKDELGV